MEGGWGQREADIPESGYRHRGVIGPKREAWIVRRVAGCFIGRMLRPGGHGDSQTEGGSGTSHGVEAQTDAQRVEFYPDDPTEGDSRT